MRQYVDWKQYVETGKIEMLEVCGNKEYHTWTDSVTGTRYCIGINEQLRMLESVKRLVRGKSSADEIVEYFDNSRDEKSCPESRKKQRTIDGSMPYCLEGGVIPMREALRLYVLFSYLFEKDKINDKGLFRKRAYDNFFDATERNAKAYSALCATAAGRTAEAAIPIRLIKGGSYKIKKYYLETDRLKDMRGASVILDYVENGPVREFIAGEFIDECVIYCGGGKMLGVLPGTADENIALELESIYYRYTISAQSAFAMSGVLDLGGLFSRDGYEKTLAGLDSRVERRMRLKLFNPDGVPSDFYKERKMRIRNTEIYFDNVLQTNTGESCGLCRIKRAGYKHVYKNDEAGEDEKQLLCASCLHKHFTGQKIKLPLYNRFIENAGALEPPQTLEDIGDTNGSIAVVYADGNNFGKIVRDVRSLPEMMYFSRMARAAAEEAVVRALDVSAMQGRFEIIAVGGDDIFVITSAEGSVDFAIQLIRSFNNRFMNLTAGSSEDKYSATLTAGVCIGKYRIPVHIMLDEAENMMKRAKELSYKNRRMSADTGSLGFRILDDGNEEKAYGYLPAGKSAPLITMLPYTLEQAEMVKGLVRSMKRNKIDRTALFKLKYAFENADYPMEAKLFYKYSQARTRKGLLLDSIMREAAAGGYAFEEGYFTDVGGKLYSPWRDIIDLWDFIGGDGGGNGPRD